MPTLVDTEIGELLYANMRVIASQSQQWLARDDSGFKTKSSPAGPGPNSRAPSPLAPPASQNSGSPVCLDLVVVLVVSA